LDGIFFSNEKISADENIHRSFAVEQVKDALASGDITPPEVLEIVQEFVEVEEVACQNILPEDIATLITQKQLLDYVHYVANKFLKDLGLPLHWSIGLENPLPYMELIGLSKQANFFERRVGEYVIGTEIKNDGDFFGENF
jgi:ribonucleotide reductase beta subunit family protein with ferritin-like domain